MFTVFSPCLEEYILCFIEILSFKLKRKLKSVAICKIKCMICSESKKEKRYIYIFLTVGYLN